MKRTRTGRLARLWAVLPFVGKHIAETFNVRRARLYVLKSGEVGFMLHRLCSIMFMVVRDRPIGISPLHSIETIWYFDEDHEDVDARGADASEAGFMAIGLKDDGRFSVEEHDIDGWRDGLERWRDPKPAP